MSGLAIIFVVAALLLVVIVARLFSLESRFREVEGTLGLLERWKRETEERLRLLGHTAIQTAEPEASSIPAPPARRIAEPAPGRITSTTDAFVPEPQGGPGTLAPPAQPVPTPPPAPSPPPASPAPPSAPSRSREEWEALIGGKLLNRIGALALIIGVGFFLKHAIDNDWISEVARVLIGVAVGVLCLGGAHRARAKGYSVFSQGLVGAGLAILYLSVYASFNFYHLVSLAVAFGLMGTVTGIAFVEAFRNDSLAVSLLACAGGLLTPILLSTPEPNEVGLFAYLLVLNLGMVLILSRKPAWVALEPVTLAGTYALYFSWFSTYYTTEHTLVALTFLSLFWGLYHGLDLFRVITARSRFEDLHRMIGWFHAALFFGALYGVCIPHGESRTALAAAISALLYAGSALLADRRRGGAGAATIQYALAGATFLAWAFALEFEKLTIVYLWTVEAALLVWLGTRFQRRFLWIAGLVLLGVTALTLLGTDDALFTMSFEEYHPILNARALAFVLLAVAACLSASLVRRSSPDGSPLPVNLLHCGWIFVLFILLSVETNDLFRFWMDNGTEQQIRSLGFTRTMVMAMVWALFGLLLVWAARKIEVGPLVFCGIAATFLAALLVGMAGFSFEPLPAFTLALNARACAVLLVAASMFLVNRWLRDSKVHSSWIPELREPILIFGSALLLFLLTAETRDAFEQAIATLAGATTGGGLAEAVSPSPAEEAARLENLKQLSLSGVWLLFSIAVMAFGIWRRSRAIRLMAMVLFGATILKIFIYDLSFLDTLYRIFSFVALGLILLAVSYLYQRYRAIILAPSGRESPA